MSTTEDLAAWGEQPPSTAEEVLAAFLEPMLGNFENGEELPATELLHGSPELVKQREHLVRDTTSIYESVGSVWEHSGLFAEVSASAAHQCNKPEPDPDATIDPIPNPFPGEFHIRQLLGEGTFGQVWLADDLKLNNRHVALKTLRYAGKTHEIAQSLAALQREAGVLANFSRHPNIVQVYAWREAGGRHYLVLEYVAGGSLAARLKKEKSLSWQDAARYIADVGEGLVAVHDRGIVHRDIKPANILWHSETDEAMLTDFGVSARLTEVVGTAGTYVYMAPESIRRQVKQEHATALDVYGLAASLFHLISGTLPFPADTPADLLRQIERGLPDPDPRCQVIPEPLEQIIRSGLASAAEQRPPLKDFVSTLRGSLNQLLADTLLPQHAPEQRLAAVDLQTLVSRLEPDGTYKRVAATHQTFGRLSRDMKKVPQPPEQVSVRTGERVRVEVVADKAGYVTVFNIGPTGNLNLLYPDDPTANPTPVDANRPLHVVDVEMTPPVGRERVFAVWSKEPLPLRFEQLLSIAERSGGATRPYQSTRDMKRVQQSIAALPNEAWDTAVLELNHVSG